MAGQVYFGNKGFQTWIPSPQTGMEAGSSGYANEVQYLNGRAFVKRSRASHRVFSPAWLGSMNNPVLSNGLQVVKNFQDGLYNGGPFYWVDPYAADQNLMAPHWAAPMLGETDWPNLVSNIAPTFTTVAYANNFPMKSATYALPGSYVGDRKFTIIIPSTHTLSFGWHTPTAGSFAGLGAGVRITPYLRSTGAATTVQNPYSLAAGGTQSVSTVTTAGVMSQFDGATYSYVEIYLANGNASTIAITIISMIAQVLLTGTTPASSGFIAGKGTTGLEFNSFSSIQYYSSAVNSGQMGLATGLVEVD
jgi:hypothetical protein